MPHDHHEALRLRDAFAHDSHQHRMGHNGAAVPTVGLLEELIAEYGLDAVERGVNEIAARVSLLGGADDPVFGQPRRQMTGTPDEALAARARRVCDQPDLRVGDPAWSRCVMDAIRDEDAARAASHLPAVMTASGGRRTREEQLDMLLAPATFREVVHRHGTGEVL